MNRRDLLAAVGLSALSPLLPLRAADGPQGKILYTRKDGERYLLHMMNADGSGDQVLPRQTANVNIFPAVTSDGKRIAYMVADSAEGNEFGIAVCNADGSDHKKLPIKAKIAATPAWSPDGTKLAYLAGDGEGEGTGFSVFVSDASGANARSVVPDGTLAMFPFWSRDGKSLGFTTTKKGQEEEMTELVLLQLEGGQTTRILLTTRPAFASAHAVSPDGKTLLFHVLNHEDKTATIKSVGIYDKVERTLFDISMGETPGVTSVPTTSWSLDGKTFLVAMSTEKGNAMYRCSADGQQRTRITPEDAHCSGGVWIPAAQ